MEIETAEKLWNELFPDYGFSPNWRLTNIHLLNEPQTSEQKKQMKNKMWFEWKFKVELPIVIEDYKQVTINL